MRPAFAERVSPRKVTLTSSPGAAMPQTWTGKSRWMTMWSVRILGRVTWAERNVEGKRARSKTDRKFKENLRVVALSGRFASRFKREFPERRRYQKTGPGVSPTFPSRFAGWTRHPGGLRVCWPGRDSAAPGKQP